MPTPPVCSPHLSCLSQQAAAYGGYGGAAGAPAAAGGGGASVWQELQDDQGRTYYYNSQTGVSQWEKPVDA